MHTVTLNPVTRGLQFARFAAALARCGGDHIGAAHYAADRWPDTPAVSASLKSAVGGGDPGTPGWASELVNFGIADDFVQAVRARTVVDRLVGVRRMPFMVKVPVETGSAGGAWISPGTPIPVSKSAFDVVSLAAYSAAVLVVLTDELLKSMSRASVASIQESLVAGVAAFIDRQFLDPAIAAVANVSPASITNGVTQVPSTGSTAAAMTLDIANMIGAVDDLVSPVWIASAKTIAMMSGTLGLPGINVVGGFLSGIPILCTKSAPVPVGSPTVPATLILLDASSVLLADEGVADVTISTAAALQMDDVPAAPSTLTSMFQTHSAAARVTREINWARTRDTGAVYMEVAY